MNKSTLTLCLCTTLLLGCGAGTTTEGDPDLGAAMEAPEIAGVWQTMYQDETASQNCIEVTNFNEDYTWTTVSLNNISSGYFEISDSENQSDAIVLSKTVTSQNGLSACSELSVVEEGELMMRYLKHAEEGAFDIYLSEEENAVIIGSSMPAEIENTEEDAGSVSLASTDGSMSSINSDVQVAIAKLQEEEARLNAQLVPEIATSETKGGSDTPIDGAGGSLPDSQIVETSVTGTSTGTELVSARNKTFSVDLVCHSCDVMLTTLEWEADITDASTLVLIHSNSSKRVPLATFDLSDDATALIAETTTDLAVDGEHCFDVYTVEKSEVPHTSDKVCVELS